MHQDAQDRRLSLFETGSILGEPGADSGGEGKSKRAEKDGVKITFLLAIFSARLDFPSILLSAPGSPRMDRE